MPTKILPAYLFLGEEDFLKEEAIEKLKSGFLSTQTKELNYSVFYAKDKNFNLNEMLNNLSTLPFLSKKRLIVLKDADSLPAALRQPVLSYLCNPKESTIFVIESPSPVIKGDFLLEVSRHAQLVYCRRSTDSDINARLAKKASLCGKRILPEAIEAIKENLPRDLRMLYSNIDNIILYIGKKHVITKQDVERVLGISPSHTAFDLIASLEKKDARKALRVFSSLKRDRKRETELLGLLAWNARMIFRVKELLKVKNKIEMRRDLGLSPRMFDQIARYASGFTNSKIRGLLDEILKADIDIKTGMLPRTVIERLIVKMCS